MSFNFEIGDSYTVDYVLTLQTLAHFDSGFHDTNPIHHSDEAAVNYGFKERLVPGAVLNGLLSHLVGVHFPGHGSLIHEVAIKYRNPCYPLNEVTFTAEVLQIVEALQVLVLNIQVYNRTTRAKAATARVQVQVLK